MVVDTVTFLDGAHHALDDPWSTNKKKMMQCKNVAHSDETDGKHYRVVLPDVLQHRYRAPFSDSTKDLPMGQTEIQNVSHWTLSWDFHHRKPCGRIPMKKLRE
jgi:hypothetical protein